MALNAINKQAINKTINYLILCKITKDYYIIVSYFKTIQLYVDFIFAATDTASPTAALTSIKAMVCVILFIIHHHYARVRLH
jgi:hypothetical protein